MSYKKILTRITVLALSGMLILPGLALPAEAKEEVATGESVTVAEGDVALDEAHFPDANFRDDVRLQYDEDDNGVLSEKELADVTYMIVGGSDKPITDLTGVEYFKWLEELYCMDNQIESLDLSGNPALKSIACNDNGLTSLNVTGCKELEEILCGNNELLELDVSKNTKLNYLDIEGNKIQFLDLSKNPELQSLYCDGNGLKELDLSHNLKLTHFLCQYNSLAALDLTKQTELNVLYTYGQKISVEAIQENGKWVVSMKEYVGKNDLSRIEVRDEGFSYDASTGLLTLPDDKPEMFEYTYKTTDKKLAETNMEYMWVEAEVTYNNRILEDIKVVVPEKTEYMVGEELDVTGMTVTAQYSDSTTKDVTEEVKIEGFDSKTAGEKTVTVTYQGKTATFTVTVNAKEEPKPEVTLEKITVKAPTKTEYEIGEELDLEGMEVTATYSDKSTEDVTDEVKVTGFDSETAGEKTITVTYEGKTATFKVTVKEAEDVPNPPVEEIFKDVRKTDWYYDKVAWVYENGLMTGYKHAPDLFGPVDRLKRAQFAQILYNYAGEPNVEFESVLGDVHEGDWYAAPVVWAYEKEIITGYTDTKTFGAADDITREQIATILYRYAGKPGVKNPDILNNYPDANKISGFAADAMKWAVEKGIITGDKGNLNPSGKANRAETAAMIQRTIPVLEAK